MFLWLPENNVIYATSKCKSSSTIHFTSAFPWRLNYPMSTSVSSRIQYSNSENVWVGNRHKKYHLQLTVMINSHFLWGTSLSQRSYLIVGYFKGKIVPEIFCSFLFFNFAYFILTKPVLVSLSQHFSALILFVIIMWTSLIHDALIFQIQLFLILNISYINTLKVIFLHNFQLFF